MAEKITIISENLRPGDMPPKGEETTQRLSIETTGKVVFTSTNIYDHVMRRMKLRIPQEDAYEILEKVMDVLNEDDLDYIEDVGTWTVVMQGEKQRWHGSLSGAGDLTEFIRNRIPVEHLFAFGPAE